MDLPGIGKSYGTTRLWLHNRINQWMMSLQLHPFLILSMPWANSSLNHNTKPYPSKSCLQGVKKGKLREKVLASSKMPSPDLKLKLVLTGVFRPVHPHTHTHHFLTSCHLGAAKESNLARSRFGQWEQVRVGEGSEERDGRVGGGKGKRDSHQYTPLHTPFSHLIASHAEPNLTAIQFSQS